MNFHKLYIETINEENPGKTSLPLRILLSVLSFIYGLLMRIRNFMYDSPLIWKKRIPSKVISIGNLTVGGTGKTPLVITTAVSLRKQGLSVAVVSRGYKGNNKKPTIVSDGYRIFSSPEETGDEPYIISRALEGVPVIIGKNRSAAARLAYERFRPDVILLDDGFQHRKLRRDIDIVAVDAVNPYGTNGKLFPRGALRESPHSLKRADMVIVTRYNAELKRDFLERTIHKYNPDVPVFFSSHVPEKLRLAETSHSYGLSVINGRKVAALSNIANPFSFHAIIEDLGAKIVSTHIFPDHHRYTNDELLEIENLSLAKGAELLIMTAKDEADLPYSRTAMKMKRLVLDITIEIKGNKNEFINFLTK